MTTTPKTVCIESPFAGDVVANVTYARACMLDSLKRGEAPFLSHLLYTQCLDDDIPEERTLGMAAGFAWGAKAELCAVYIDRGVSGGMQAGIARAQANGIPVVTRRIEG
jgi:hypothetical protein